MSRAISLNALNAFGKSVILCVTGGLRFDAKILVAQMRKFLGNERPGGAIGYVPDSLLRGNRARVTRVGIAAQMSREHVGQRYRLAWVGVGW